MIRKIFVIALYSIRQNLSELRIILLFLFMIIFVWNDVSVIADFSRKVNVNSNPFVYSFFASNPIKQLILLTGIIFLFSDSPFINENQPYIIIRSKRKIWGAGQVLYIIMMSAIYNFILMLTSVIALLPYVSFSVNDWGKVINTLAQTNANSMINLSFDVSDKIISYYSPLEAFGYSFLLNWGISIFLGLVLFVISLKISRMIGLLICAMMLFMDLLFINTLSVESYYFSPVTLSRLNTLDPVDITKAPQISYAFLFYSIGMVCLTFISIIFVKKKTIEITIEI